VSKSRSGLALFKRPCLRTQWVRVQKETKQRKRLWWNHRRICFDGHKTCCFK